MDIRLIRTHSKTIYKEYDMKKTHLAALIVFAAILSAAFAVTASAQWWNDNPFSDVSSDSWYHDSVRITKNNGLLSGVSESKFGSELPMTRAMFVTALASGSGYDKTEYSTDKFTDVPQGEWYASAVAWAVENGIASGTGENTFSQNKTITRQELVAMLLKYAGTAGYDVTVGETSVSDFPDADNAADWAKDALCWAYEKGIISGTASGNDVYLCPAAPATRAQVAVMLTKLLYTKPSYKINGNDISLYRIVYSPDEPCNQDENAENLSKYIELSLGVKLEVVSDESEPGEYEILVGKTNREENGLVIFDRTSFPDDNYFIWSVQGNYLLITGIDTDASRDSGERTTMNIGGTKNAVITFAEKILGMSFYMRDLIQCEPDPVIELSDGYENMGNVTYKWHDIFNGDGYSVARCENYRSEWGCGLPHQLGNIMFGRWKLGLYDNVWDNPCYTDPDNIASLIQNVRELLEKNPRVNLVGLIQNDSLIYCHCENCMKVFRETGSRSGVILSLVNKVCEALEEEYPNVKYATWAYNWTIIPPNNLKLHKNIIMYYNSLAFCSAHAYSDKNCSFNAALDGYLTKWRALTGNPIEIWDHSGSPVTPLTPCSNFDDLLENARFLADHGAEGIFMNNILSYEFDYSDFNVARAYLYDQVYRDSYMTQEEYYYKFNGFLKTYYGNGWRYLREYIDIINELGNHKCHIFYGYPGGFFDFEEIRENAHFLDELWIKAKESATDEEIKRIENEEMSWIYLKQCAFYETQYLNGSEEQREAYIDSNKHLHDMILEFGHLYAVNGVVNYDDSPDTWSWGVHG